MYKLKILYFWLVVFKTIFTQVIKGYQWHMIYVDFHTGDRENGVPVRKQLIGKKTFGGFSLHWQDLSAISRGK